MDTLRRLQTAASCCAVEETKSQDDMVVKGANNNGHIHNVKVHKLAVLQGPQAPIKSVANKRSSVPGGESNGQEADKEVEEEAQRFQVGGGTDREVRIQPPSPKTGDEMALMTAAVKNNKNLQAVLQNSDQLCEEMVEWAWKEIVPAGTDVVTQGDLEGDYFYVIQEGSADVFVNDKCVIQLKAGSSFGELALLFLAPRAATVRTTEETWLWVVDRNQFKAILAKAAEVALQKYTVHMMQIEGMEKLHRRRKTKIAQALQEMEYVKGDIIYHEGDPGDSFFFITEGEIAFVRGGVERSKQQADGHEAPIILGNRTMLVNEPRSETVRVVSDECVAMMLDKGSFNLLMTKKKKIKAASLKQTGIAIDYQDITSVGVMGHGTFGLVELVEHSRTGDMYALKSINKGHIVQTGMQSGVHAERDIMFMCDSPFIVKLFETYNTDQILCFLMEAVMGGELHTVYRKQNLYGSEMHSRYYIAGVIVALEHMHAKKILYRDLKPENVLIDAAGRPKLTDFGNAKVSLGKTFTACGALEAMAPEIVKCIGYNNGADWWALGVLMFELMSGAPPFQGKSPTAIYQAIFKGIEAVNFEEGMRGFCEDLVKKFCHEVASKRMGMLPGGVRNIKKHMWYKAFDWEAMECYRLNGPFQPIVKSKNDLSNFKKDIPNAIPSDMKYTPDDTHWDADFATNTGQ